MKGMNRWPSVNTRRRLEKDLDKVSEQLNFSQFPGENNICVFP